MAKACRSVVTRASLGRYGPQHIREIFTAILLRYLEVLEVGVDLRASLTRFHDRSALALRQKNSTAKVDRRGAGAVCVVDGLYCAFNYSDVIDGRVTRIGNAMFLR